MYLFLRVGILGHHDIVSTYEMDLIPRYNDRVRGKPKDFAITFAMGTTHQFINEDAMLISF